jgi:hypothetical protein
MKILGLLAAVAAISLTSVSAEARDGWFKRKFFPWQERHIPFFDDEDDVAYYSDDDEPEVYIPRRRHGRVIESETEAEEWWLDDGARNKLEKRKKARKQTAKRPNIRKAEKPAVVKKAVEKKQKPKVLAATKTDKPAAKSIKPVAPKLQTASLTPVKPEAKPKAVAKAEPKSDGKTIGCTAGAAVIVGYGFGDVKPKACTGNAYAYSATRAGKAYEIKLTAASGEITDVKKLN